MQWLLGTLQDEERWSQAFLGSQDALSRLAYDARADTKACRATQLDPDKLLNRVCRPVPGLPTANCQRTIRGSQEKRTVSSQAISGTSASASRRCTTTSRSTQFASPSDTVRLVSSGVMTHHGLDRSARRLQASTRKTLTKLQGSPAGLILVAGRAMGATC